MVQQQEMLSGDAVLVCDVCFGVQVGTSWGEVQVTGPSLQRNVFWLHHGAGFVPTHGLQAAMAFSLLCVWLHWHLLVPGLGKERFQLSCS